MERTSLRSTRLNLRYYPHKIHKKKYQINQKKRTQKKIQINPKRPNSKKIKKREKTELENIFVFSPKKKLFSFPILFVVLGEKNQKKISKREKNEFGDSF